MHICRVDLNLFVVFMAIHAEGSVTRAAQRMNLTQPAISHALARLRDIFNDPLFVRQGHAMVPTPLARTLITPIRQAVHTFETVVGNSAAFDPAIAKRRFSIGLRDVMETVVLPPLMVHVARTAPGISLTSTRVDRAELEKDLGSGLLDVAVDVLMPLSAEIRHTLIANDGLVVVARRGHPGVGPGLTLGSYLEQEHILVTSRRQGMGLADREVARLGHQRRVRLRCQQSFAACRVVSETDLILTMPARYARIANLMFDNQVIPAPFDGPSQDVYLYWHENAEHDPANLWLREQLFSAFGPLALSAAAE